MLRVSLEMFWIQILLFCLTRQRKTELINAISWSKLSDKWKENKMFSKHFPFSTCVMLCLRVRHSSRGVSYTFFTIFPPYTPPIVCVCASVCLLYIVVTHHHHHRRSLLFTATRVLHSSSPRVVVLPHLHLPRDTAVHKGKTYVPWDLHVYYSRKQCFLNNSWWCRFITYNNNTTPPTNRF